MLVFRLLERLSWISVVTFTVVSFNICDAQTQNKEKDFKTAEEIEAFFLKTRGVDKKTQLIDLVLPLEVNFKLNSAELTERAREQLDNLAAVLLKPNNKNLKLELAGHTCDLGGEAFNMDLSRRRIASSYQYLKEKYNIDESRLSSIAYGESLPVIANATSEEERAINRRVVVYLPENRTIIEKILKKNMKNPGFQWAVFHYTIDNVTKLVSYDGNSVLKSNDQYRVYIRPVTAKYVYIYQKDSHGNGEWLFPRDDSYMTNPVTPGEYYLPHRSQVFVLDDNLGRETISILAADKSIPELDDIISGQSSQNYSDIIAQVVKTRGLKVTRIAPPPKGPNTQEGNINIAGLESDKKNTDPKLNQENTVSDIMTEYGEFYIEIQFDHK
jgi:outer membrane protein OmpA-like peptidoglycan-associated protein